jgi:hypothetical protein
MALRGVISDYERSEAYKAKIRSFTGTGTAPDYVAPVMQHKMGEVYRKIAARFAELASFQARLSSVISAAAPAVTFVQRAAYQAFGCQLYHLILNFDGHILALETQALQVLWNSRGLDPATMDAIHQTVFGIPEP